MGTKEIIERDYNLRKHLFKHINIEDYIGETKLYAKYILGTLPLADVHIDQGMLDDIVLQAEKVRHYFNRDISFEDYCEYVVQAKINNEALDASREFFANKVSHLVNKDSILETVVNINTWIIEVVQYRSTDARTKNPYFTYLSGTGRCGEKSTLMVHVCRSVGIPARQIYAPWWSHTDDRHAWVEVLIDGKWQFLGAGDSNHRLNEAWFKEAASRAIVIQTNHYSNLAHKELVLDDTYGQFKRLNISSNYTKTRNVRVRCDLDVPYLSFEIVNYASFKKLFKRKISKDEIITIELGKGTFFVRAQLDDKFYLKKIEDETEIIISEKDLLDGPCEIVQKAANPKVQMNTQSKEDLDKISQIKAKQMEKYYARMEKIDAEGINNKELNKLYSVLGEKNTDRILKYLSEKDLQDFNADDLIEYYHQVSEYENNFPKEIYERYILCPRIYYEAISPYAKVLKGLDNYNTENNKAEINVPDTIAPFDVIKKYGAQDALEEELYKVALLRSNGQAAYYDEEFSRVMVWENNEFVPLVGSRNKVNLRIGKSRNASLSIRNLEAKEEMSSKIIEDEHIDIFEGKYEFLISRRLPNGNIVASMEIHEIKEDMELNFELAEVDHSVFLENIDISDLLSEYNLENTGVIIIGRIGEEPSQHTINELSTSSYNKSITIFDNNTEHELYENLLNVKDHCQILSLDKLWFSKLAKRCFKDEQTFPLIIFYRNGKSIISRQGYEVGLMKEKWIYEYMEDENGKNN